MSGPDLFTRLLARERAWEAPETKRTHLEAHCLLCGWKGHPWASVVVATGEVYRWGPCGSGARVLGGACFS